MRLKRAERIKGREIGTRRVHEAQIEEEAKSKKTAWEATEAQTKCQDIKYSGNAGLSLRHKHVERLSQKKLRTMSG